MVKLFLTLSVIVRISTLCLFAGFLAGVFLCAELTR
jgi:hypothetical protein